MFEWYYDRQVYYLYLKQEIYRIIIILMYFIVKNWLEYKLLAPNPFIEYLSIIQKISYWMELESHPFKIELFQQFSKIVNAFSFLNFQGENCCGALVIIINIYCIIY